MSQAPRGNWNYPTSVRFGAGRIAELPAALRELGVEKPLLITDPGLAGLPPVLDTVALLGAHGVPVAVFSALRGNPTGANVADGVAAFKAGGFDGVIALGGGSALDVAKAVAMMIGQDRDLFDYEDREDWWTRIDPAGMVPLVAVPTTSGTGSEVGRASVITDERDHTKKIIFHPKMQPAKVICDPALTVGLPPALTAWTGMDALSHNLEAFCAPGFHPQADGVAMEGMRLVHAGLLRAFRDGADLEARSWLMAASLMGATAFQKGLGGMHALAHPIGAVLDAQHGLTNAVLMPYVLVHNREAIAERMGRLARLLDLPGHDFAAVLQWVLELRAALGIPHTAAALGVTEAIVPQLASMAAEDPSAGGNPTPFGVEEATAVLRAALTGAL